MQITKYRFIAEIYPHLSMEAEVEDEGRKYYVDIDVNTDGNTLPLPYGRWWAFTGPIDEIDPGLDKYLVTDIDFADIVSQLVTRWNDDPVFRVEGRWKGPWLSWEEKGLDKEGLGNSLLKEFAERLDGIVYAEERHEIWKEAKKKDVVIVFGYSDDCLEFRGAFYDEIGAFGGVTVYLEEDGVHAGCGSGVPLTAVWCGQSDDSPVGNIEDMIGENGRVIPWTYRTEIPHETFMMYEDEEPFCRGIVFSKDSIGHL